MQHVHVGAVEALVFLAYLLILGFIIRSIQIRYSDTALGQALAFIY